MRQRVLQLSIQVGLLALALPGLVAGHLAGLLGAWWRLLRGAFLEGWHTWLPEQPQDGDK